MTPTRHLAALTLALTLLARPAGAEPPRLAEDLQWLDASIASQEGDATWWWTGWLVFLSGASVANAVAGATLLDGGQRSAAAINAVGAGFGATQMGLLAAEPMAFAGFGELPEATEAQRLRKRDAGCATLRDAAERQATYRAPLTFILPAAWAGASVTFLQWRYNDPLLAVGTGAGILATEGLRLATAPQAARTAWGDARRLGVCGGAATSGALRDPTPRSGWTVQVVSGWGQLGVVGRW